MSCANQTTFINPEYMDKKITNAILLLSQFENSDFIQNEELFTELTITKSKEEYYSLFVDNFEKCIDDQSTFQKIKYFSYDTAPDYETQIFDLDKKNKFKFDLPPKPIQLDISGYVFILFLEDLLFSFSKKTKEATTSTRTYTVSGLSEQDLKLHAVKNYKYYITLNTKYVIYDNSTGDVISYGTASTLERVIPPTDIDLQIKSIIQDFVQEIFKKTPFEK